MLPLGPGDLDETAALYGDPEVMRHVAAGIMNRATTSETLEQVERTWHEDGYGLWAIRDAETGAFLGEGGLQPGPNLEDVGIDVEVEFGYTMCRRSWGHGYATEAAEAILADAWTRFRGREIHAVVTSDNLPSQKVLRKLRFKKRRNVDHHDRPHQLWSVERA